MSDKLEIVDNEMLASFADDQEYQSNLGSDFQDDIKGTAHFKQAQLNNFPHPHSFLQNIDTSPITRMQFPASNENISQDFQQYSLRGSDIEYLQQNKEEQMQIVIKQNFRGHKKVESMSSEELNNKKKSRDYKKNLAQSKNSQQIDKKEPCTLHHQLQEPKLKSKWSSQSQRSQVSQNSYQSSKVEINQDNISEFKKSDNLQKSLQKNSIRLNIPETSKHTSYQTQENHSLNVPSHQLMLPSVNQQNPFRQTYSNVNMNQSAGEAGQQLQTSEILERNSKKRNQDQLQQFQSPPRTPIQINGAQVSPQSLNRYYGSSRQKNEPSNNHPNQNGKQLSIWQRIQSKVQGIIPSNPPYQNVPFNSNFQKIQQRSIYKADHNLTNNLSPKSHQYQLNSPQQQSMVQLNKVQNATYQSFNTQIESQKSLKNVQSKKQIQLQRKNTESSLNFQQNVKRESLVQPIQMKPISVPVTPIIQQKGPNLDANSSRLSRIFQNQQSQINATQGRSISYGSNDSKKKPPVYFTYTSNFNVRGIGSPKQNLQTIRENERNTKTNINPYSNQNQNGINRQKKTMIIWEQRYLIVSERFNLICLRFQALLKQYQSTTRILQNQNQTTTENFYSDITRRHQHILSLLEETHKQLTQFQEEKRMIEREVQYEKEVKEQFLYRQKFKSLQAQYSKLQQEVNRLKSPRNKQEFRSQYEQKIRGMEEELLKSHTFNNQLQVYISQLELDNNKMFGQIDKIKVLQATNSQYVGLIKNQETIIRQLESELKRKDGQKNTIEEYIVTINKLEGRIRQLEQSSNISTTNQYNEKKYSEIIDSQKNIIQNLQNHLKQFNQITSIKENELKEILKNQQSIIGTLEEELKRMRKDASNNGASKQREQALQKQVDQSRLTTKHLQYELQKSEEKLQSLRAENANKTKELALLKEQRSHFQKSLEEKLQQKLLIIEQQIRSKSNEQKMNQSQISNQSMSFVNPNRQQLQELMQENDRLASEVRKRQQQKRKLQDDMMNQNEEMRRKVMQKESQLRLLNEKFSMLEQQNKRRLSERQKKIKTLEEDNDYLNNKIKSNLGTPKSNEMHQNSQISSPSKGSQQIKTLKDRIYQKEQEASELQRVKENMEKKLSTLQINFNSLDEDHVKKVQEVMNLKRQVSNVLNLESEVKTLSQTIGKKNQQIIELKSVAFEKSELKIEVETIKNQRNNLKSALQIKNQEIDKLKQTISELEGKMRQTKQRQMMFPTNNQSLIQQLQVMYESVKKKQAQLNKMKQTNQLLETNVQQLQFQIERVKTKMGNLQKNMNNQKEEYSNNIKEYQNKIKELEARTRSLDQSQKLYKNSLNVQIQNLENIIKERQELIRKLEGENKVFKHKLKNHQSKVQQYDSDIENLNKKIKQLEANKEEMKKNLQSLESGNQNNNKKLYDDYQIKIVELEAEVKVKDSKIKHLESTLETLKIKIANHENQNEDDFINQQQIQVLKKKIAQYQSRLLNYASSRGNGYYTREYQSTLVFEQKAIYELKAENERLRLILSQKGFKNNTNQNSPDPKNTYDQLQKRLIDFNRKLQQMIEENKTLEQKNPDFSTYLEPKHQNQKLITSFEKDRSMLIRKHRNQMTNLQARLVDLQRYCSTLEANPHSSVFSYNSNSKFIENAKNIYSEQLGYYREKNVELQERIDNHIKINKELKEKIESLGKGLQDNRTLQFYRSQIAQLQKEASEHLSKIKALSDENKMLKQNLDSYKNDNTSQLRISELENKIHEQNRKNTQLQMQNGILDTDITKYLGELKNLADQLERTKQLIEEKDRKIISIEQSFRQTNSKNNNYQVQITKLTNQIKLVEAENERMSDRNRKQEGDENNETSKLKSRIFQLQSDYRELQENNMALGEAKLLSDQTILSLNQRIVSLQSQVSKLTALYENLVKKVRQSDNDYFEIENKLKSQKNKVYELEKLLKQRELQIESANQFLERIKKQRDNEGTQSKHRLTYIAEMQETIKSLRLEASQYKIELERTKIQIAEYRQQFFSMNNLEQTLKQLRLQNQLQKSENERLKSLNEQLKQKLGSNNKMENTIQQLMLQNSRYKAQNDRLRRQKSKDKEFDLYGSNYRSEQEMAGLKNLVQRLESEVKEYEIKIEAVAYKLEYLRSTFIQIQSLIGQIPINTKNQRQIDVVKKVKQSLASGLNISSQVFTIL